MKRYKYRPLLPARHSIRLIQIQPGLPGTEIHCRIVDYTIRDDRASGLFEALSYVWGTTSNPSKIFVADMTSAVDPNALGHYLEVTSNLHEALQELRDPALPRIMWIDAVCINQDDLEERSSQVSFMAKVYSHANQVVIWLGPGDVDETRELFAAIEDAAEIARLAIDARQPKDRGCDDFLEMALLNFLARPYFSRVWMLQEAAAARSILVKCGVFEMPGSTFTNGVRYLQTISIHRNKRAHGLSFLVLETMMRYKLEENRPLSTHLSDDFREVHAHRMPSLGDLMEKVYLHGVSDRRDTIFAILSLCSPTSRCSIKPDYTKPWSVVWADTMRQILGPSTIMTTPAEGEQACLTVSGYILGTVRLYENLTFSVQSIYPSGPLAWEASWWAIPSVSGSNSLCYNDSWCKRIQNEDILFFAVGAAAPSIIRACGDHFDIIVIAVPSPSSTCSDFTSHSADRSDLDWHELLSSLTYAPMRASLVWDWCSKYPSSCTHHPQLFDGDLGPHPDTITRMEDSAHIIATLLPSMNSPTRKTHTASQRSLDYMLQQSDKPKFPSHLQTKLQLLRMLVHSKYDRDLYVWLVRQFETLRQILWILCHHTDTIASCKWMFDYHRSERYPYYNIFDVMSIVGLEARPQRGVQVVTLRLIEAGGTHNGNYFADLFELSHREERLSTAQRGIRHYLVTTVIRHSSFTLEDIQTSPQSLLMKPLIKLHNGRRLTLTPSFNLRAFDFLSVFQPGGKLALSWSGQEDILDSNTLSISICLFSGPLISIQMAYSIMSAIFSLALDRPPLSLQQRIDEGHCDPGEHWLIREISTLIEIDRISNYRGLVSLFVSFHLETLMRYIDSTEVLDIAAATANDNVLPFLRGLLDLGEDRSLPLQDYREHMIAQFAASKALPLPSDSENLLDGCEDPIDDSQDPVESWENLLYSSSNPSISGKSSSDSSRSFVHSRGTFVCDEGSSDSGEDSSDSRDLIWEKYRPYPFQEEF